MAYRYVRSFALGQCRVGASVACLLIHPRARGGQIDEVTFNDELGDGVPVDTALADAMAAFNHLRP